MIEMGQIDGCDMEKFSTLDYSEKTIAIVGDRKHIFLRLRDDDFLRGQILTL